MKLQLEKVEPQRRYRGCKIIDANDVYVCVNEHGKNIGQSRTVSGAEGIIDEYKDKALKEDTIKQNGKWVNKGKEGTHGTFRTKKAADEQRKAMFARGYKKNVTESLKNNEIDDFLKKAKKLGVETLGDLQKLLRDETADVKGSEMDKMNAYYQETNPEDKELKNESLDNSKGQWNQADIAREFGIYDEMKALEKDLLAIKGVEDIDFDLNSLYDFPQVIFLTKYEIPADAKDYFKQLVDIKKAVRDVIKKHGLTKTDDPVEDQGEWLYWVTTIPSSKLKKGINEGFTTKIDWDGGVQEITKGDYNYFLNILPPAEPLNKVDGYTGQFLVGEPYDIDEEGNNIFSQFGKKDGKYYFLGTGRAVKGSYIECVKKEEEKDKDLKEDLTENDLKDSGLYDLTNSLIKDELEAIDGYNSAIVTFETEGKSDYTSVFRDILAEEQNHIGQLQKILDELKQGTIANIEDGQKEADDQISTSDDRFHDKEYEEASIVG